MTTWNVKVTERAEKDILKLDRVVQKRLKKKLQELIVDPIKNSVPLINSEYGDRRFRIGDYRVIFDVDGHSIRILHVGHRREIYR